MIGQRMVAGIVLLFVFALGGIAGVFFDRHHLVPRPGAPTAAEVHEAAMADLEEFLDLDETQVEQIHAVLANRQHLVQQAWEQVRPEVQSAMLEVHVEIAALLRPEQREHYHAWLTRQREESRRESVLIIPH